MNTTPFSAPPRPCGRTCVSCSYSLVREPIWPPCNRKLSCAACLLFASFPISRARSLGSCHSSDKSSGRRQRSAGRDGAGSACTAVFVLFDEARAGKLEDTVDGSGRPGDGGGLSQDTHSHCQIVLATPCLDRFQVNQSYKAGAYPAELKSTAALSNPN